MPIFPTWPKAQKPNVPATEAGDAATGVEQAIAVLRTVSCRPAAALPAIDMPGDSGDVRAATPLIDVLKSSKNFSVKEHAIDALGRLGDPRAIDPLIAKLQDRSDDFYIRKKAARTLYVIYRQGRLDAGQRDKVLSHWHSWYLL